MENTLGRTSMDVERSVRLGLNNDLLLRTCFRFNNLGDRANKIVIEKLRQEEEWENYPDEFGCAIMGELMEDPVKLPSGNVCERKNIERHILSTPNDPFNRQHLTEDMLVSDSGLKAQIEAWKKDQRNRENN